MVAGISVAIIVNGLGTKLNATITSVSTQLIKTPHVYLSTEAA
jgi:hypothetical protein